MSGPARVTAGRFFVCKAEPFQIGREVVPASVADALLAALIELVQADDAQELTSAHIRRAKNAIAAATEQTR